MPDTHPNSPANPADPTEALIRVLDRWQRQRIIVVGDFMLDRYVYGSAERLSPDAPVPVMRAEREQYSPGGASNVCLDLCALGCDVSCIGVVGSDPAADRLRQALADAGCDVSGLIASPDRPTTVKHNFVGLAQHRHPQKMFRVDEESTDPLPPDTAKALRDHAAEIIADAAVLCIEDYNKGVVDEPSAQGLIALAREANVPVLVDPAAIKDYAKYRGATCLTPNRTEAAAATGISVPDSGPDADADLTATRAATQAMAESLVESLNLDAIVLTLDKHGALLLEKGQAPRTVPTEARSVYDVTGAGDMVLAMLAGAIANGTSWHTAVELANCAAGLEVEKFGCVPIELSEVLLSLLRRRHQHMGKLREIDALLPELAAYRKQGKSIAFTNGCFDILHAGHVAFLRSARQAGDLLVVAVNSDDSIRRLKGPDRPVNEQADRVMVLSELESVDYVIVFNEDTPEKLLEAIRPNALIKGGDYTRNQVVGGDLVESWGGKVVLVNLIEGRSTTNIIQTITASR